jgi:2-polyprenyl-6-methoxyphenol hydroxylase-like FAD-dependent oxidoreductase
VPLAVVSGLGPNGMLAALELRANGWDVVGVEKRREYVRSIHVSVRASYLDDVRALDPVLADRLQPILSPIAAIEHTSDRVGAGFERTHAPDVNARARDGRAVTERLRVEPIAHVRLDELEQVFAQRLTDEDAGRVRVVRAAHAELVRAGERCDVHVRSVDADVDVDVVRADLVVVAEGGKSASAVALGAAPEKRSRAKHYISVHVDHALGPVTRRLDTDVDVAGARVPVSFWATGHRDAQKGTWLVLEIPAALHGERGSASFDRAYFDVGAARLLGLAAAPAPTPRAFSGTFRFEQQLLARPAVGANVVFFGDAAGMGHHALSSGLELGAWDLAPLRELVRGGAIDRYARAVADARTEMLALGMPEYAQP